MEYLHHDCGPLRKLFTAFDKALIWENMSKQLDKAKSEQKHICHKVTKVIYIHTVEVSPSSLYLLIPI